MSLSLERLPGVGPGLCYPPAGELINPAKGEETLPRNLVDLRHAVIHALARNSKETRISIGQGLMVCFDHCLGEGRVVIWAPITREELGAAEESMKLGEWNDPGKQLPFSFLIEYADEQGWVMMAYLSADLLSSQVIWRSEGKELQKPLLECSHYLTKRVHNLVILA